MYRLNSMFTKNEILSNELVKLVNIKKNLYISSQSFIRIFHNINLINLIQGFQLRFRKCNVIGIDNSFLVIGHGFTNIFYREYTKALIIMIHIFRN